MNGNRKFKSLRLVRFGDVLYDQQKRLIMLCRSCQRHYLSMEAFQTHLSKCIAVKHIVTSIDELQYDEEKRETRLVNGKQEVGVSTSIISKLTTVMLPYSCSSMSRTQCGA